MKEFSAEAEKQLNGLFPSAEKSPFGCSELLCAALLSRVGPVVVSGVGSTAACANAFVFRKPAERGQDTQLLVCYRRSCDPPYANVSELRSAVGKKLSDSAPASR